MIRDRIVGPAPQPAVSPPPTVEPEGGLSCRELEVLRYVAKDLSSKKIADSLGISERTVHQHLTRIYSKLGTSSRLGAVLIALKTNLLSLDDCRH